MSPLPSGHLFVREDFAHREKVLKGEADLSQLIDATCLSFGMLTKDVEALCQEAQQHNFRAVCIPPAFVSLSHKLLGKNLSLKAPKLCTVIGFPFAYSSLGTKSFELQEALQNGAQEVDIVHSVHFVKEGRWKELVLEYKSLVALAHEAKVLVKLILETSLLTPEEIQKCVVLATECGVDVIKTSTGFGTRGACVEDVETIRNCLVDLGLENTVGIKASGGIRTPQAAWDLVRAGATRLGTRSGIGLLNSLETKV